MKSNPLIGEWNTPFSAPPFDKIGIQHYSPAIHKAIRIAAAEIKAITSGDQAADFRNSVVALERSGAMLGRITSVLFNLNSAETSKQLQSVAQEISPLLTRFSNDITLNRKLFSRIREVYEARDHLLKASEEKILAEKKYRSFVIGGAGLTGRSRKRFRDISEELSKLSLKFEENVLEETNSFELHLNKRNDLAGLPENIMEMASMEAKSRGKKGWVFTLHAPSYVPFMQYSERRELREKMFRAYSSRCFSGNENDNTGIVLRIVNLRLEMAKLLGFENYAGLILGDRMADSQDKVEVFLDNLQKASGKAAARDFENVSRFAAESGHVGELERWDWAFYSEKLRKKLFDIDDEILRPYFSLEKTEQAIFGLAGKLYGLSFRPVSDIPVYHPEVRTFEVLDKDGSFLSLFYADYHPRPGKSGGAWMTSYRDQHKINGKNIRPFISIVCNFARATESRPSLLSFTELTTFLHEFGHALHGMLSDCTYESLSGTNVARDFVELPSQFMENFAYEKAWLDTWAAHYETGEKIPADIIKRIREASTFNEGYSCYRQLGFGFLDMAWHTVTEPVVKPVRDFELDAMKRTELFPVVEGTCMSTSFGHIFGGGYAAGYYGYKWAEVLDADAFSLFNETGIFNEATATSFRKNILEKGGTGNPMDLYIRFRGKKPSLDAFLKRSGLL